MRRLSLHESAELPMNSRASLRVYADSRPHVLQTASLQKGIILVCNGRELVEEGLGIGVPVCRYRDSTHFSLSAETFVDQSEQDLTIIKVYNMNGVAGKRFRGVPIRRGRYLANLLRLLEKAYRGLRRFRVRASMPLDLLSLLGMRNEYLVSHSRGQILVSYSRSSTGLQVRADLRDIVAGGLQGVVFVNEQSGRLFNEYTDSNGTRLRDAEIEPWCMTSAKWADLHSREFGVGFRLHRPQGWCIVRGREVVKDRISWSGLDLVYEGAPKRLEYQVQIL